MNPEPLRILLIADYFGRDRATGAKRANAFAKYWSRNPGVEVTALTAYKHEVPMGPVDSVKLGPGVNEVRVRWPDIIGLQRGRGSAARDKKAPVAEAAGKQSQRSRFRIPWKAPLRFLTEVLVTPDRYALWASSGFARGMFLTRPHVVVATAPSFVNLVLGRLLAARFGVPYVVDLRDPWHDNPFRPVRTGVLRRWGDFLERFAMRRAARAWVTTEEMMDQYSVRPDLIDAGRLAFVANGYDEDEWTGIQRTRTGDDVIEILHAGSLYGVRDPIPFLEDLGRVLEGGTPPFRKRIRVRFLGPCDPRFQRAIEALTERYGLESVVSWEESVGFREALQAQIDTDVLLLVGHRSDRPVTQIPLKLYEALRAHRPQLAYFQRNSAVAQLSRRHPDFGIHLADLDAPATRYRALENILRRLDVADEPVESDGILAFERSALSARALAELRGAIENRQGRYDS